MNKFELTFSVIRVPVDFMVIILAGLLSYQLRISNLAIEIRPIVYDFSSSWYNWLIILFALVTVLILAFSGMYAIKKTRGIVSESYLSLIHI